MKKFDIIKNRDKRNINRRVKKAEFDKLINLSAKESGDTVYNYETERVRLLDEGVITYSDGSPLYIIKKGTIDKFLNNENEFLCTDSYGNELLLDKNFVGHIDKGHIPITEEPVLLGTWGKEDLFVVEKDDGRKALDVVMHLDEELSSVKDLLRIPYDVAISAEFFVHEDIELSLSLGIPVYDEIFITGIGIVGDGGNVDSNNISLKGDRENMEIRNKLFGKDNSASLATNNRTSDVSEAELGTNSDEDKAVSCQDENANELEVSTNSDETSIKDVKEQMLETIETLKDLILQKDGQIKALEERLNAMEEDDKAFKDKFKTLSIELADDHDKKSIKNSVEQKPAITNGFGSW